MLLNSHENQLEETGGLDYFLKQLIPLKILNFMLGYFEVCSYNIDSWKQVSFK